MSKQWLAFQTWLVGHIEVAHYCLAFIATLAPTARFKSWCFTLIVQFILALNVRKRCILLKSSTAFSLCYPLTPEDVNKILTDDLLVYQNHVYSEKCKRVLVCCLQCHGQNHLSYTCPQSYDVGVNIATRIESQLQIRRWDACLVLHDKGMWWSMNERRNK